MNMTINKQWGISISFALALIGGAYFVGAGLAGIRYEMKLMRQNTESEFRVIRAKIDFIDNKVEKATEGRWTSRDMRQWASLLQALNGDIMVPEATGDQYRGIDADGNSIRR